MYGLLLTEQFLCNVWWTFSDGLCCHTAVFLYIWTLLGYDRVLEKRFGGPGTVLESFVSNRVGTLIVTCCQCWDTFLCYCSLILQILWRASTPLVSLTHAVSFYATLDEKLSALLAWFVIMWVHYW